MEAFINFAYTGRITITQANVLDLTRDADYIGMTDVRDECVKFLETKCMHPQTVFETHRLADMINCAPLKLSCRRYMRSNFHEISQSEDYVKIDLEFLKEIVPSNRTQDYPQETVFDAVMRWMVHRVSDREVCISELMGLLRLSDLDVDYFINFMKEAAIMDHRRLVL